MEGDNNNVNDTVVICMDQAEDINNVSEQQGKNRETAIVPWIIPRPTLVKMDTVSEITIDENLIKHVITHPTNLILALPSTTNDIKRNSASSSTSSSSASSSKSANSNTLLLTAANLATFNFDNIKPHHEYINPNSKNYDTESLASSTHFTLVNGMERRLPKHMKPVECCCERHQLSILITTMTVVFTFTIFICIYFAHTNSQDRIQWS